MRTLQEVETDLQYMREQLTLYRDREITLDRIKPIYVNLLEEKRLIEAATAEADRQAKLEQSDTDLTIISKDRNASQYVRDEVTKELSVDRTRLVTQQ